MIKYFGFGGKRVQGPGGTGLDILNDFFRRREKTRHTDGSDESSTNSYYLRDKNFKTEVTLYALDELKKFPKGVLGPIEIKYEGPGDERGAEARINRTADMLVYYVGGVFDGQDLIEME